ncbi:MAG: LeuD/DmdB family oxidoreductase small subunit [Candidatus Hodarchaeales archaeon]|jgi:3-isopropylmalate/(R)-2-methylmalate dehydratase small subunit
MGNKPVMLEGKAVVLKDSKGNMINNIDTDMIFHNRYLHIIDIEEMGQHALDNLEGWKDFAKRITDERWTFLVVGGNFGSGSSRQQAVDCFSALGIKAIIGESFGAIYKRNGINSGMPLVQLEDFDSSSIKTNDELTLDLEQGKLSNKTTSSKIVIKHLSRVQLDIYQAGSLFDYAKKK